MITSQMTPEQLESWNKLGFRSKFAAGFDEIEKRRLKVNYFLINPEDADKLYKDMGC